MMYWRLLNMGVVAGLVLVAAYAYDIKYQSTLRAERVAKLSEDLRQERDAVASLRAEWARLGNPRRIQALADRHLSLTPVNPSQYSDFGNLPERPPQIVQPTGSDPIEAIVSNPQDADIFTGSIDNWLPKVPNP